MAVTRTLSSRRISVNALTIPLHDQLNVVEAEMDSLRRQCLLLLGTFSSHPLPLLPLLLSVHLTSYRLKMVLNRLA